MNVLESLGEIGAHQTKNFYKLVSNLTKLSKGNPRVIRLSDQEYQDLNLGEALERVLKKQYCEYDRPSRGYLTWGGAYSQV